MGISIPVTAGGHLTAGILSMFTLVSSGGAVQSWQEGIAASFSSAASAVVTQRLDTVTAVTGAPTTTTPLLGGESMSMHPVWADFSPSRSNAALGESGSGWTWNNGGIW